MSIYRLTGKAGRVIERSGVSGTGAEARAWVMRSQEIEVAPLIATRIDLEDGQTPYAEGSDFDYAVEVEAKSSFLRTVVRGAWPGSEVDSGRRHVAAVSS
jgi:hypothetical protein